MQADIAVAPSDGNRIYATVANPQSVRIYRSDDAGDSWTQITTDNRPAGRIGGGDLPVPAVDPKNADTVIIASTVSYRSTDGGKTWIALRGAPGGDDYQRPWISPVDSKIIAMASDQGAIISVNGGETRGAPGTTSRRRRCITSTPTTRFPTASAAGSRKADRPVSPAAATTG